MTTAATSLHAANSATAWRRTEVAKSVVTAIAFNPKSAATKENVQQLVRSALPRRMRTAPVRRFAAKMGSVHSSHINAKQLGIQIAGDRQRARRAAVAISWMAHVLP
jgi:hypothetical protein